MGQLISQKAVKDNSLSLRSEENMTINPLPMTNQNQESSRDV